MARRSKSRLKVYKSEKIELTEQEMETYRKRLQRELEKFERDSSCGGVNELGYVRLHDRH